ncbi:MAG: hypothetical protein P8X96_12445, partial [Desulfobacteraceae bacterium]
KADAKVEEEKATKKAAAKETTKKAAKTTKKPAAKTTKKTTTAKTKKSSATAAKKKAAPTAKKAATKKAAPKKAAAKKTGAAKAKAAPKKAKAPKKISVKELVFKKFEPTQALPEVMPAPKPAATDVSAPPLTSSADPKEAERIRALLFQRFDMNAIKAAAKAPVAEPKPVSEAVVTPPAEDTAKEEPPAPEAEPEAAATPPVEDAVEKETAAPVAEPPKAGEAYITVAPPIPDTPEGPINRTMKIALAAAATIIFLVLAISYNNSAKYYIYPKDNAIEIWKGRFSPKDKEFFMVLHGMSAQDPIKETYTKKEVFPLIFDYYVDKADTLLEVPGLPDYEGIKAYLHKAEDYIVSSEMRSAVSTRLNNIQRMTLLYKADVALSKDTDESLESAIKLLKAAGQLTSNSAQDEEITQKIEHARARRAELKSAAEQTEGPGQ